MAAAGMRRVGIVVLWVEGDGKKRLGTRLWMWAEVITADGRVEGVAATVSSTHGR